LNNLHKDIRALMPLFPESQSDLLHLLFHVWQ